jgi:RHS repeat-associated protein
MQNLIQFSFSGGDLTGITDPLLNTTTRFSDGVGRLVAVTNPLGRTTRYSYNPLNQILQVTDPLQGNTSFTYDLNGNLLTVQDANQGTTTYTYTDHDLVATRTDPLQRTESYTYDANENLATFTDRKGQVTTYTYDNLNRMNFVGFGTQGNSYASTISYQYDAGNRMTQATDSISGVLGRGFDGLDRLTSETTPQGSISYTYDAASRRATMQVAGQSQVSYTFDNGNRLTQIAQGTSTVGFTYDNANRRSTLTLPNGIVATYSYDNDSHLTGIAYSLNSTSVGSLTYGYDGVGTRNSVTGSFARTGMPQPIPSASYDQANQLLAWNELAPSYDSNGNMLNDGVHNYAWDARNHLSTIDSGSTGSFVYDPAGRRATKVISGTGTNFLYDQANPVQELSGTTPTANLLTGGVDQYFTRTDSNGTADFLTDALGSTAALTDSTGTVQTQYSFDPFGNTTQSGNSSTNSFSYTGRENDGTGLYFNRARYYSSNIERFISEDPAGLTGGGPNFYSYVANSPTNFADPLGLTTCVHTPNAYECWDWSPGSYNVIDVNDPQPPTIPMSTVPLIPPRSPKPPDAMAGRNCGCKHKPAPKNDLEAMFQVFSDLTHPLDVAAANVTIFIAAGGQVAAAGVAITGGCLNPTPFEPVTCFAGSAAGTIAFGSGTATGAFGVYFFKNYTLPAFKNWGCDE